MKRFDVKIDGVTIYYDARTDRNCVIEASLCTDGAALVARGSEEETLGEVWLTEASCLHIISDTLAVSLMKVNGIYKRIKVLEELEKFTSGKTSENIRQHEKQICELIQEVKDLNNQLEALKRVLFKRFGI